MYRLKNIIKKRRNALHGISQHQKRPSDSLVKRGQYPIAVGIMRADRDDPIAASVVVPIVSGFESRQCLDEVPLRERPTARGGSGVGDLNVGRRGSGPGYLAVPVGERDSGAAGTERDEGRV